MTEYLSYRDLVNKNDEGGGTDTNESSKGEVTNGKGVLGGGTFGVDRLSEGYEGKARHPNILRGRHNKGCS